MEPGSLVCFTTTSHAAETAPQRLWPSTTISGEPRCSTPYSIVPSVAVSAIFPALRATNNSPRPTPPKINSGDTRLSEQVSIVAHGDWALATPVRCLAISAAHRSGALKNFSLPALSFARASSGVTAVAAKPGVREALPPDKPAARPAAENKKISRRLTLLQMMHITPLHLSSRQPGRLVYATEMLAGAPAQERTIACVQITESRREGLIWGMGR